MELKSMPGNLDPLFLRVKADNNLYLGARSFNLYKNYSQLPSLLFEQTANESGYSP